MTISAPAISKTIPAERLAALQAKIRRYEVLEAKERCEGNLSEFVREAWSSIDSAPFVSCWAIDAMADHLEAISSGHIKRLLINISPRCAKPVSEDAIVLTKRGLIKLSEIVVGDLVWTHKARWRPVTAVHEQGVLPVFKILTWTGREVEAAGDHPFLTPTHWVDVRDLKPHDVLGLVPLHPDHDQCGSDTITLEEARLLGYLVGDGSCGGTPNITCGDDRGAADMMHCARMMGFDPKEYKYKITKTGSWLRRISLRAIHVDGRRRNKGYLGPVRTWIHNHGLDQKSSYTKMVPSAVMLGSNDVVADFVGAYWSCDGFVTTKGPKRDGTERDDIVLGCDSVNRAFLLQLQMLLMRLGINSRLRKKTANIVTKRQGNSYVSWTLVISTQDDAWRFADRIKFFHEKYDKLIGARKRRFDFDRSLIGDSIDSIEPSEPKPCRCLTVEEDLSFTANGFAVHNTSVCSIIYPAWTWARSDISFLSGPQVKFLCASYNHSLALDSSNKARRLLFSPWYQKHWTGKIILQPDQNTKGQYDNTAGGSRISTSVGGSLLGLGADIVIADDLNKVGSDKKVEMETDAEAAAVENFWNELHSTRLNDPKRSAVIAVQQRTKERDVSGIILDSEEDFVHLMIPMRHDEQRHCVTVVLPQYEDEEPWQDPREVEGELMWEERFGETEVRKLENALGPFLAAGRLQQAPAPKGGGIIKRDWWQPWDQDEAKRYGLEWNGALKEFPPFELVVGSLDTSYGEKQENDYNALTIWGIWIDRNKNRRAMLMFAWNKRLQLHGKIVSAFPNEAKVNFEQRQKEAFGLVEYVADTCKRYKVRRLLIENKTRGRDVANELNRLYVRESWGVELIEPVGDKVSRTHSIVPLFTDNVVWAPDTKWADAVITQSAAFPKADHDDMHDTVTQFLNWARENGILVRADEMSASLEDEMQYRSPGQSVAQQYGV